MNKKSYKKWKLSKVLHPCKIVDTVCKRYPSATNRALIAHCVKRGVSYATASARISKFKSKQK